MIVYIRLLGDKDIDIYIYRGRVGKRRWGGREGKREEGWVDEVIFEIICGNVIF